VKRIADERASERQSEQQRYENGWDQDRSSGDVAAHGRVPAANENDCKCVQVCTTTAAAAEGGC
jgi:hypothetical protein